MQFQMHSPMFIRWGDEGYLQNNTFTKEINIKSQSYFWKALLAVGLVKLDVQT